MGPLSKQDEGQALARVPESVGPEAFSVDAKGLTNPKTVDLGDEKFGTADELRQKADLLPGLYKLDSLSEEIYSIK